MGKELESFMADATMEIASVAGWLWQRGWAERNAGNISMRVDDDNLKQLVFAADYQLLPLQKPFPALRQTLFLVTGTNTRMRDVAAAPLENILLIMVNDDGTGYHIISRSADTPLRPTSELSSHLCIHDMLLRTRPGNKVVMHTHVTELIALTHIRDLCDGPKLNRILLGMHPEARVFVPAGAGFVPYLLPGTATIGEATVKALEDHSVAIWEKHGVFATGSTPQETFDIIDLLAKSASVWFLCRSAGYDPEGLTESQLEELAKLKF
jgi:rhamnulose-1-phosphate aldolase